MRKLALLVVASVFAVSTMSAQENMRDMKQPQAQTTMKEGGAAPAPKGDKGGQGEPGGKGPMHGQLPFDISKVNVVHHKDRGVYEATVPFEGAKIQVVITEADYKAFMEGDEATRRRLVNATLSKLFGMPPMPPARQEKR